MNGERYLQDEKNLIQDNAGGLLPFSAGTTLTRNQRVFPIRAQLNKLRLIFFIPFLILFSCNDISKAKYQKGDVVYLKPDSTKALIIDINRTGCLYEIKLDGSYWIGSQRRFCDEDFIFSKQ